MMDYIAGLVQRGLISPDVAQGLVQQIANWKPSGVQQSTLEGGGAGTRIGATTTREPLLGRSIDPREEMRRRNQEYYKNYGDLIQRPAEASGEIPVEQGPTGKPASKIQTELERQDRRIKNLKLEQ